jgi:acetolactate synthase I/II/III large subunit
LNTGDRIICSSAISSMGTGLAETIGAFFTHKLTNYYCIFGDGSIFMNVQDLHTIRQYNIPVIISVINNNGYLAIRHTQSEFQDKRFFGTHPEWGLTMPSVEKIANGFDIPYRKMDQPDKMSEMISELMSIQGPVVCEVVTDPNQEALFKQKYLKNSDGSFIPMSLQDMYP